MNLSNPEIVALVSALGGGVAVKIIDYLISRSSKRMDEAGVMRKELREEIKEHKKEVSDAEHKIDEWQERYYALIVQCKEETTSLKAEIEFLKRKVEARK